MKMNGLIANPNAANPPTIAVPEPLALPEAAGRRDIGWTAVIAVSRTIITRPVIVAVLGCDRAADNGATEQSGGYAGGDAALRLGGSRRSHGRNSQGRGGSEGHKYFRHRFTFLIEQGQ